MSEIKKIISPDTQRQTRLPPGQRLTEKWPVLHYGGVPSIDVMGWILKSPSGGEVKIIYRVVSLDP